MGMISAQCDELRKAAQTYRTLGGYEMEQMLLDAADAITELRGALLVASVDYRHLSDENAKLRELVAYMWTYDYAGHFSTLPEHMEHVDAVWQQMQLLGIEVSK